MSEAEIGEQLVGLMEVVLAGVSLYFTLISAYIVALWAFLTRARLALRVFAFAFYTAGVLFLIFFFLGVSSHHSGLVQTLQDIGEERELTAASQASIANSWEGIDQGIQLVMWLVGIGFYVVSFLLTFFGRTVMKPSEEVEAP